MAGKVFFSMSMSLDDILRDTNLRTGVRAETVSRQSRESRSDGQRGPYRSTW